MTTSKPILAPLLSALVALGTVAACTAAQLEPLPEPEQGPADNKLRVTGEVCTTDPDDLNFPVKILFLIDASSSMETTDPTAQRAEAIIDVIDSLSGNEGVEYGIVAFGLGANILTERCDDYETRENCTPGFATTPEAALAAVTGAAQAAGTTDYIITLQTAISMLANDMATSNEEDLENARYVIAFLSDGIPDADSTFGPNELCPEAQVWANTGTSNPNGLTGTLEELIENLEELAKRYDVRELSFNGAFVAAPDVQTEVRACGSNLIRAMSNAGKGVFRDFSSGEAINFLFVDFTSYKRIFSMKSFMVTNLNARPFSEALYVNEDVAPDDPTLAAGIIDSDGDGLTDELEVLAGSATFLQDTDRDGFSDLLEYNLRGSGFDMLDPTDADCAALVDRYDFDGDGLRDCEERFAGTNPKRYDSDLDGFGDGIEYLYGSGPALNDALLDVDFDGADNGAELRWHSQPDTDDISYLSEHAYRYEVVETGLEGARTCYSFDVSNISLASTTGALAPAGYVPPVADAGIIIDGDEVGVPPPDGGVSAAPAIGLGGGYMEEGENRVIIEVTEAPFDAPNEPGINRLACVRASFNEALRLRIPANGLVELEKEDFHDAREFDPVIHCVDP